MPRQKEIRSTESSKQYFDYMLENVDKMRFIHNPEDIYIRLSEFTGLTKQDLLTCAVDLRWTKLRRSLLICFWVSWFGLLLISGLIMALTKRCPVLQETTWLQKANVYQIFPRSFLDMDHDGIGDIKGIIKKLEYFYEDLKVNVLWINPFYPSDMVDAGYGIINHTAIDTRFGNMYDFDKLLDIMHTKEMKLIIDFVPNHTSKNHKWFKESRKSKSNSFADYYIWHPGNVQLTVRQPPNNWRSLHGGSAWTFDNTRQEFYLHQFFPGQPDLNLRNKEVIAELKKVLQFWMHKGVDGFHLANADYLFESEQVSKNEEIINISSVNTLAYEDMFHNLTKYQEESFTQVGEWSNLVHNYRISNREPFLILSSDGDVEVISKYKKAGKQNAIHIRTNIGLTNIDINCLGRCIYKLITSMIAKEKEILWPMWMIGDKYNSRVASRMGSQYVNAMNMLLMTLRGTPITYYGEEIGMIDLNLTSPDVSTLNLFGSAEQLSQQQLKYDEYRSPMQWTSLRNAGFTSGRTPWRPIASNYLTANVKTQKAIGSGISNVEVYRMLSVLRKIPVFIFGKFSPIGVHSSVFCFVRHAPRFKSYLIAINFGPLEATVDFVAPRPDLVNPNGLIIATTFNMEIVGEFVTRTKITLDNIYLRPTEGFVVEMEPST